MKYNTKSAEVLSEADRFEGILNFTLFVMEQDARLWSRGEDALDWIPGDDLFEYPKPEFDEDGNRHIVGNYPRPMFELFYDDGQPHHDFHWAEPRCDDCLVSWVGNEPCFVCGEVKEQTTFSWLKYVMLAQREETSLYGEVLGRAYTMWRESRDVEIYEYESYTNTHRLNGLTPRVLVTDEWLSDPPEMLTPLGVASSRRSGRQSRVSSWVLDSFGDPIVQVGERPEVCDRPIGSELYDPYHAAGEYDHRWARRYLPRDLDLSVRPVIDPPVVHWPNPTLERYLANPDRAWHEQFERETRRRNNG